MSLKQFAPLLACAVVAHFAMRAAAQEVLPFHLSPPAAPAARTMQESVYRQLPPVNHLPKDAPNILIVLIDDVGPGQTDTYGGEIHTPTLSKIANEGISTIGFTRPRCVHPPRGAADGAQRTPRSPTARSPSWRMTGMDIWGSSLRAVPLSPNARGLRL